MVKIYVSSVLDAPAERVWDRIRDFNALPKWHPLIADSRIEGNQPADKVGCIRSFHTRDGGHIRERLLALSDYDYSCTYAIIESPMGVSNYVAIIRLVPVTDGNRTFCEWTADFECPAEREAELRQLIGQGVFKAGFDALKQQLAKG
jgi:Polyketide cyclase / dehydrase and lipid transport